MKLLLSYVNLNWVFRRVQEVKGVVYHDHSLPTTLYVFMAGEGEIMVVDGDVHSDLEQHCIHNTTLAK